jgi:ferredoxin
VQRHRIIGLLLGYSPEAIGQFEELGVPLVHSARRFLMDKFDATGTCKKCGTKTPASYEYHDKGRHQIARGTGAEGRLLCPTEEEHMHRGCEECGYEWAEAPLA